MRIWTSILFGIILLISCTEKKADFNIVTADTEVDTLEIKMKYDSFESKIKKNLMSKIDTSGIWKSLASLTDTSLMKDWNDESVEFAVDYFKQVINELNKPNEIRNMDVDAIHFTILNTDYLELEMLKERILFSKNKGKVKSKKIGKELWGQVSDRCKCEGNDNLNYILMNSQGNQIFRLDITEDREYKYCWKILKNDDILNQLVKEIEK
jgi:hypothetical protein